MQSPQLRRNHRVVPVTDEVIARHDLKDVRSFKEDEEVSPFLAGEARVIEDWLEVPARGGWIVAYRVAHSGTPRKPRTRILEVRMFPDERERPTPGEWSATYLGNRAKTKQPFLFERLHRGATEKTFNAALEFTRENAERRGALPLMGHPGRRHYSEHEGRGAGRPGLSETHFAQLAYRYAKIEFNREPGESTRDILQQKFYRDASLAAIGRWIKIARKRGFLTRTTPGSRGGMATKYAYKVLQRGRPEASPGVPDVMTQA